MIFHCPRYALAGVLATTLISCSARTDADPAPMENEALSLSIESAELPLAATALDLAAPAEFETATFALG